MSNEEFDGFDIDEVSNQLTQVRVKNPNFSRDFWHKKLAQMRDFLKPLKEATVAVSAQLTPTAHVVVPHLELICDQIDYIQPVVERSFLESSADAMASNRLCGVLSRTARGIYDCSYAGPKMQATVGADEGNSDLYELNSRNFKPSTSLSVDYTRSVRQVFQTYIDA